jgi:hypothetical protein
VERALDVRERLVADDEDVDPERLELGGQVALAGDQDRQVGLQGDDPLQIGIEEPSEVGSFFHLGRPRAVVPHPHDPVPQAESEERLDEAGSERDHPPARPGRGHGRLLRRWRPGLLPAAGEHRQEESQEEGEPAQKSTATPPTNVLPGLG